MFRLRKDARRWFRYLRSQRAGRTGEALPLHFDVYHLCLMAGLATGTKQSVPAVETTDLVATFPQDYGKQGRLVVALFLATEIENMGIAPSDRSTIHHIVGKLLDATSPAYLSAEGFDLCNRYSYGGFEILRDSWFMAEPRLPEVFLPQYVRRLREATSRRGPLQQEGTPGNHLQRA